MDLWYFDNSEIVNTTEIVYEMLAEDGVEVCKDELFAEMYTLAISENQYEEWSEIKSIASEIVEHSAYSSRVQTPVQTPTKEALEAQFRIENYEPKEYQFMESKMVRPIFFEMRNAPLIAVVAWEKAISTPDLNLQTNALLTLATNRLKLCKSYKDCFHNLVSCIFFQKSWLQNQNGFHNRNKESDLSYNCKRVETPQ